MGYTDNAMLSTSNSYIEEGDQALRLLYHLFPKIKLSNIQERIFIEAWNGKTYKQISEITCYDSHYLRDVGHKLWKLISKQLGETVSKHNIRSSLQRKSQNIEQSSVNNVQSIKSQTPISITVRESLNYILEDSIETDTFIGYPSEYENLCELITNEIYQVLGIFGLGGTGKSTLMTQVVNSVREDFDCILWKSLRDTQDFDIFIASLIQQVAHHPLEELPQTSEGLISLLITCLQQKQCLIILDDWHSILSESSINLAYQDSCHLYGLMLRHLVDSSYHSKVVILSREKPSGAVFSNSSLPVYAQYLNGFSLESSLKILETSEYPCITDLDQTKRIINKYSGNPYALIAISKTIQDVFMGNINEFIAREEFIYGDVFKLIHQQFSRLSEIEKRISIVFVSVSGWITLSQLSQNFWLTGFEGFLLSAMESLNQRSLIEQKDGLFRQPDIIKYYLIQRNKSRSLVDLQIH